MEFGRSLMKTEFMFEEDMVFLNHGSYGAVPKCVFEEQIRLKKLMESHPDKWYRFRNIQNYKENLIALCDFIGTKSEDTILVGNVTEALNTVMTSLNLGPKDVILISNLAYNAVKVMCEAVCSPQGPQLQYVTLDLPLTKEKIMQIYKSFLDQHPEVTLAILDHIASPSAIRMPLKELTEICKDMNVITLVDGAHSCGQIEIKVEDLGADFYGGNVHKWMFTPRGCGYLWVNPQHHKKIKPVLVSHFHGSKLHYDFCVRGTRDDTPFHCIKKAIEFHKELGGHVSIHNYVEQLLKDGVNLLTKSWGTQKIDIPSDLEAPFMKVVLLPDLPNYENTSLGAGQLEKDLLEKYHIQTICRMEQGKMVTRVSAHVYNSLEDFEALNQAVLDLKNTAEHMKPEDLGYASNIMHWDLTPLNDFKNLNDTNK